MTIAATENREQDARVADGRELVRRAWGALPAFLVSGSAVCAAGIAVIAVAGLGSPLTPLLAAVLPGPLYSALVAQAVSALAGDAPGAFSLVRFLRTSVRRAMTLLLPAGILGALTVVAHLVADRSHTWLALVPVGAGSTVSVLLLVAAVFGFPLGAARPELGGIRLTLAGLHVAARRPVELLGTVGVIVIALWAATQISGTLLFLLPAPMALVSALAARLTPSGAPD